MSPLRYPDTLERVKEFALTSEFKPAGDQPKAIAALTQGFEDGLRFQTLLGVTGTGKTYTAAHVIAALNRPALVLAPNKALAAQLANEFRELFPENRVEYFVSYYDYYQPEAYVPQTDTYIEKDASINDEIDRLRHAATSAVLHRRDVICVASVSAIYGLGSPEEYESNLVYLRAGDVHDRDEMLARLVGIQYERNDLNFTRGKFRVRGDTLEVFPAYDELGIRVEMFGDEVDRITRVNPLTGEIVGELDEIAIYPATHYTTTRETLERAIGAIETELAERLAVLDREGKLLEAQRLRMRTNYDLEMLREVGYCNGIENYSRHLDGREPGETPYCLLDYFPDDFLVVIDESHVTVPQLHGQYEGDRSRKEILVEHGFRLPCALDNRPLRFDEIMSRIGQCLFLSATPSAYELAESDQVVEQIVRPTGLLDPEVVVKPTEGQIDDLIGLIKARASRNDRVLVTTLTKKMAEDLTDYLLEMGIRVRYLHSEVDTLQRVEILRDLRLGEFDVLVGINLLREGLDLPEVSLVAILDADKEGFLRSQTSLIQTIGRAARNVDGSVVMYADNVTDSMRSALSETNRRRALQSAYNTEHGIDPQTIRKRISDILSIVRDDGLAPLPTAEERRRPRDARVATGDPRVDRGSGGRVAPGADLMPTDDIRRLIDTLEAEMHAAAKKLEFEYAARLRDEIRALRTELRELTDAIS
ncbi:MAG: excinuclease ABC subunit UvrB [Acidimicrobiia bacterium]|nr:excinuclease ABC subunit UvrB [Acidimicrobiia bacterium]